VGLAALIKAIAPPRFLGSTGFFSSAGSVKNLRIIFSTSGPRLCLKNHEVLLTEIGLLDGSLIERMTVDVGFVVVVIVVDLDSVFDIFCFLWSSCFTSLAINVLMDASVSACSASDFAVKAAEPLWAKGLLCWFKRGKAACSAFLSNLACSTFFICSLSWASLFSSFRFALRTSSIRRLSFSTACESAVDFESSLRFLFAAMIASLDVFLIYYIKYVRYFNRILSSPSNLLGSFITH
jgi:hypothetical protein